MWEQYEKRECIGEGSEGKVYLVWDNSIDRMLALKIIRFDTEEIRMCYDRQVTMLKKFGGRYFPMLINAFVEKDIGYILMEYIEGENLKELLDGTNGIQPREAFAILQEISQALQILHRTNEAVVFGDLKAENVMVKGNGEVKLIDFGGAIWAGKKRDGKCIGTYGYAPNEQWRASTPARTWWDIYALNKLFHYMLTGNNPAVPPYTTPSILEFNRTLPKSWNYTLIKFYKEEKCQKTDVREYMKQLSVYKRTEIKYLIMEWIVKGIEYSLLAMAIGLFYLLVWGKSGREIIQSREGLYGSLILLMITFCYRKICIDKIFSNHYRYRREKNIWKSAKKGICIFLLMLLCAGQNIQAGEGQNEMLPVLFYNDSGETVCIREDAILKTEKNVRIELPIEVYEEGKVVELEVSCRYQDTQEGKKRKILFMRESP